MQITVMSGYKKNKLFTENLQNKAKQKPDKVKRTDEMHTLNISLNYPQTHCLNHCTSDYMTRVMYCS